jgi:hypothetical protein
MNFARRNSESESEFVRDEFCACAPNVAKSFHVARQSGWEGKFIPNEFQRGADAGLPLNLAPGRDPCDSLCPMRLLPAFRLLAASLAAFASIGCSAVGCHAAGSRAGQGGDGQAAAQPSARPGSPSGARAGVGEMSIGVSDPVNALKVSLELDGTRAAHRVISKEGGSLTAVGEDGSTYKLTIPENALVGDENIILTPVKAISGLPGGVTLAAGVQMAPEGLLLLKPATLTVEAKRPAAPNQELPFGWSREGDGVHAQFVAVQPTIPTFTITHFSGVAVASASASAADSIVKGQALPCGSQMFADFGEHVRRARYAALTGASTPEEMESLAKAFIDASRRYLNDSVKPVVKQAGTDDLLLPCAAAALYSWEHAAQTFLGEAFDPAFAVEVEPIRQSLWKGAANAFGASYDRCMRNESPLFQLGRMIGAARQLEMVGMSELVPADAVEKIQACGRRFDYRVDVETEIENVYNEQAQGADVASSKTKLSARGIVAKYDEQRSQKDMPLFSARAVPAEATVSIVPRHPCPDEARMQPGSSMGVTIRPILNTRVGELRCEGGKAKCDNTDVNPGALVELAPQAVENIIVHLYTGSRCASAPDTMEFMMFEMGRSSIGSDEPFQVRGDQGSVTVVRHGTRKRRMPVNVPPQILAMTRGMKDYVEIDTPAIKTATERTRMTIQAQRQ